MLRIILVQDLEILLLDADQDRFIFREVIRVYHGVWQLLEVTSNLLGKRGPVAVSDILTDLVVEYSVPVPPLLD